VAIRVMDAKCILEVLNAGADVTVGNVDGDTPLHVAAQNDDVATMQLLVERGGSTVATNVLGDSPLHVSCRNEDNDGIAKLLENAADPALQV
jgi:ankyrin repeat protein